MKTPKPIRVAGYSCSVLAARGQRDDGRWYWRIRHAQAVAESGWYTREEVERVAAGLVVAPDRRRAPECRTVRDLLELWLGVKVERAPERSVQTWTATARALVAQLGDVQVERLTLAQLDSYVSTRRAHGCRKKGEEGRGIASMTISRELRILREAWTWGRGRGYTPDRDLATPKVSNAPEREHPTPTPEEVVLLLGGLSGWPYLAVRILAATGLRLGELATLRRDHIRVDGDVVWLDVSGKTKERPVPVFGPVARELRAIAGEEGLVLPMAPGSVATLLPIRMREACEEVGIPAYTPHALRRMAVDRLYTSGADVGASAKMLGHSPEVALKHYRNARTAEVIEAARTLSGPPKPRPRRR